MKSNLRIFNTHLEEEISHSSVVIWEFPPRFFCKNSVKLNLSLNNWTAYQFDEKIKWGAISEITTLWSFHSLFVSWFDENLLFHESLNIITVKLQQLKSISRKFCAILVFTHSLYMFDWKALYFYQPSWVCGKNLERLVRL